MTKRKLKSKEKANNKSSSALEYLITGDGTITLQFDQVIEMIPRAHPQYKIILKMLKESSYASVMRLINFNTITDNASFNLLQHRGKDWYIGARKVPSNMSFDIDKLVNKIPDEFIIAAIEYEESKENTEEVLPVLATSSVVAAEIAYIGLAEFCRKYAATTSQYFENKQRQYSKTLCIVNLANVSPQCYGQKISALFITKNSRQVFACYIPQHSSDLQNFDKVVVDYPEVKAKLDAALSKLDTDDTSQNDISRKSRRISLD